MDDDVVNVELTYETYSRLRDAMVEKTSPNVRPLINKALEFFRKLKPKDVLKSLLNGKTLKYYYDRSGFNPYVLGLKMARGIVRAKPEYLEEFKRIVTPKFVLLLLKYENPEVYSTLEVVSNEKRLEWIRHNIDDLVDILTPKKERE